MGLIKMFKFNPSTYNEMVDDGFCYRIYDWKESERLISDLALISQGINGGPLSFRVINMKDDAYHVVYAPVRFTTADARLFIKLSLEA